MFRNMCREEALCYVNEPQRSRLRVGSEDIHSIVSTALRLGTLILYRREMWNAFQTLRERLSQLWGAAHPPSSQLVAFIQSAPGMPRLRRSLKHRPLDNSTGSDDPTPRFAHRPCGPHCRSPDARRRDRTRPRLTCRRIKKEPKRDAVNGLPHHQRNSHYRAVLYCTWGLGTSDFPAGGQLEVPV